MSNLDANFIELRIWELNLEIAVYLLEPSTLLHDFNTWYLQILWITLQMN